MIIETKEVYKCEHCRKLYQRKHAAIKHEAMCKKNPYNNRPCFSCPHLEKKKYVDYGPYGLNEYNLLHCSKKEEYMYPPQVEVKDNFLEIDDNHPMPRQCDIWDRAIKIRGIWDDMFEKT